MNRLILAAIVSIGPIAGCSAPVAPDHEAAARNQTVPAAPERNAAAPPSAAPARPAAPGALPDLRPPVDEAPLDEKSAQGAAEVVRRYFALLEARDYGAARRLWDRGGDASGKTEADFAADYGRYRDYRAGIGAPGRIEGAAGSSFVEVPVQLHGRLADGSPFRQRATVTLRRVNDVPGATEEQRRWHISDIAAGSAPE